MRQKDARDALGKDLAHALLPAATPTAKQYLDSDGCSLHREVAKFAPVTTMAGTRSSATIRANGVRRAFCFNDPTQFRLHNTSDLQTVQCRKQCLIGEIFSHLILTTTRIGGLAPNLSQTRFKGHEAMAVRDLAAVN